MSDLATKREETSLTPKLEDDSRPSATPPVSMSSDVKPRPKGPQLIGHLPRAEQEARSTFEEIPQNHYQYNTLGRSREALESMTCDCQYEHGVDDACDACGDGSDCINRLTQVECLPDDCRCRAYCQNQRFQRKEYAPIEIVQTEKKGFGLRAADDIPRDAFIYEYVGDVVSHPSFMKRMREYAQQGIRHFYFMMLQKDEYIDATKRGGIGRFANHSCNPNCYVAKWTVGARVRMGIFAKRAIKKDEEITFNYNVDRYGHEAQPCYCGEANCVGFLGGKTQTDIAAMDDLYLDALGITDEVEKLGLKGSKKRKGKKLDEDYLPVLKPLVEKDVPKVIQAMRQTQSRKVLFKLLHRVKITEDQSALRQLMRLRGFSLMTNILTDYADDEDITKVALECMTTWPLIQRNKVEDSKVDEPVRQCAETSQNEDIKELAQKLLAHWDTLEVGYRIPKRLKVDGDEEDKSSPTIVYEAEEESRPSKRSRLEDLIPEIKLDIKPLGRKAASMSTQPLIGLRVEPPPTPSTEFKPSISRKEQLDAVIAEATAAYKRAEEEAAKAAAAQAAAAEEKERRKSLSRSHSHKKQSKEDKEALKEKRLQKLVGAIVVKCMSKYSKQMDYDMFKKHAKGLTTLISDKEKKSNSYKEGKLDSLSEEKTVKIKKFAKEYIHKLMRKLEKSGQHRRPPHSSSSANGASTSASAMNGDAGHRADEDGPMAMTVEEAMDMDMDEDDDDAPEQHDGSTASPSTAQADRDRFEDSPDTEPPPSTPADKATDPRRSRWDIGPDKEQFDIFRGSDTLSVQS
ncbi:SET domain-containing protein [Gloeophyllum trabeum ATCC 11539]|uniref:Histone-lysine N-methyltransferase, H3 lysine-36 specific n=1 Tax=Gloeophyllum trabeum (strain ATCC 11539 / FP-39264 / Madison 617) TaxID=670483 RepID=S7RN24_GLOTA|nr:SET domain-containing protein [Gloeophyllum trabeum ATCC 11539]EPQ55865.1 SET domain-containing protein [Gloeophyllum trabeum ATCC 11539]